MRNFTMKQIIWIINIFFFLNIPLQAQQNIIYKPTDQPDADGRIIKGREGTHHWQPYMQNADLSDYHHAPEEAVEQFKDLKYGLRIHWGIYSIVNGRESWVIKDNYPDPLAFQGLYHNLYKGWYPEDFDADKWTDMMVDNGFTFFVFTTKHHDGFSMYDTKTFVENKFDFFGENAGSIEPCHLHYSIMETPFKRDVTAELVKSARAKGLKIGLYFSHPDWYDADFRFDEWNPNLDTTFTPEKYPEAWTRFEVRHKEQIKELLTNYGKIDMQSFDMWFPEFAWDHMQEVARMARELQPDCMLRWRGIGNYGDYHTPENYIPGDESQGTMAWQVIHTLSTRSIFSYEPDPQYIRGGDWIVSKLIDIVAKGGNLMIGVGPDLAGNWNPKALESLHYASEWLKVNGEAVYKTRPCKIINEGNIYFTRNKANTITYAIVEGWPGKSLNVGHIKPERKSAVYLLGYDKPLNWARSDDGIVIKLTDELQKPENRPCEQAFAFRIIGTQQ
jgi:alpha-L-fucosidase